MTYNITILQEAENIAEVVIYANDAVSGALVGLFMLSIFFIMLMALKRWDFDDSLLSTSFVCFILSSILSYGKFLNLMFPLMFMAIMAFTAFYMVVVKDS